jgi:UDP-N-acetylmuramate--alanine ligase
MLAELMRLQHGIAVAGTHGKTTTTSLIAHVLDAAGLDPTAVIGGRVLAPGTDPTGARIGRGEFLVAEADESDGSFLRLMPVVSVITNIDPEHLDHYGSYDALRDAFVRFANQVPFWGVSILCLDHPGVQAILPRMTRRITTYGFAHQADFVATDVETAGWGMRFGVRHRGEKLGDVRLHIPGRHNVANALATLCVALELDVPFALAAEALEGFVGIERRFETKGIARGIRVVDDYGHHPAEICATLAAARGVHDGRIVVVFQPHRFTRTRDLFDDFATAFIDADVLLLTEIYAAGEEKIPGVEARALAEAVRAHGHRDVRFVADLEDVPAALAPDLLAGDLVVTLGAGSIHTAGPKLLRMLQERGEDGRA